MNKSLFGKKNEVKMFLLIDNLKKREENYHKTHFN